MPAREVPQLQEDAQLFLAMVQLVHNLMEMRSQQPILSQEEHRPLMVLLMVMMLALTLVHNLVQWLQP